MQSGCYLLWTRQGGSDYYFLFSSRGRETARTRREVSGLKVVQAQPTREGAYLKEGGREEASDAFAELSRKGNIPVIFFPLSEFG